MGEGGGAYRQLGRALGFAAGYIKGYRYPKQSEQAIFYAFKSMRREAGLADCQSLTPHGIRRFLDTFFTTRPDVNPLVWYDFARWRQSRGDMLRRYRHSSPQVVDRIIFNLHPLLPLWRGETRMEL